MKNLFSTLFFLAAFLTVGSLQAQNPNIVSNPSFENNNSGLSSTAHATPPGFVSGVNYLSSSSISGGFVFPGWTGSYTACTLMNNTKTTNDLALPAVDGYQYLNIGSTMSPLTQTLNVTPNTTYYVCVQGGTRATSGGGSAVLMQIDGATVVDGSFVAVGGSGGAPAFLPSTIGSFTPTSSTAELTIEYATYTGGGTAYTPVIDYVYVGTENYCPATASELPPSADSDSDGVVDASDNCPGTPSGTTVDAQGCPDTDGDAAVGLADPDGSDPCNPDSNDAACGTCNAGSAAPALIQN